MTETEFHQARRMWAVTDHGVLHVARPGDARTHREWLADWYGADAVNAFFSKLTRGYVLDGRLVAYRGDDFSRWVDRAEVLAALDELETRCGPIHTVALGVRPGGAEHPWPVVVETTAEAFRKHMAEKVSPHAPT